MRGARGAGRHGLGHGEQAVGLPRRRHGRAVAPGHGHFGRHRGRKRGDGGRKRLFIGHDGHGAEGIHSAFSDGRIVLGGIVDAVAREDGLHRRHARIGRIGPNQRLLHGEQGPGQIAHEHLDVAAAG